MSELLCTICQQSYVYERFLTLHCGHVFCEDCILRLDKERKCPVCRYEWGSRSPFKIYLNFPDLDKSTRILQHLDSINQDTPAVIVQKTGDIIKGLVGDPKVSMDDKKEVALLDAVHRLEERVTPLVSDLERVREENEVLRQQLKSVHSQLKAKEALSTEMVKLNKTIMEREVGLTITRDELAHEKQRRNSEQDTNRRLTRSLRKKQEEITTKDKEIERLKSDIQERDKQLGLMKTKLRALAKLTKPPKATVQNPDDSLIVEQPLLDIENSQILKRTHKSSSEPSSSNKTLTSLLSISKRRRTGAS